MRQIFFSFVILLSLGFLWARAVGFSRDQIGNLGQSQSQQSDKKSTILKFALVADSHNDNENLKKALEQAKDLGAGFVIGLGDWSSIGTLAELKPVKTMFDESGLKYYLTAGDHDLWDSRNRGDAALANYRQIFGNPSQELTKENVQFVIVDNSDIYKGISQNGWEMLSQSVKESKSQSKLTFVFAHKTPFHPTSSHVMGANSAQVTGQAKGLIKLIEENKVDGFFSGDLHFFARFSTKGGSASGGNSPEGVKITTIGAVDSERNFQGPRFAVVTVWDDYSWGVEDVEIR